MAHPEPAQPPLSSRDLILDAARGELADHGYESATLRSIARRAGVDPRLIRHYFSGKQDLIREALGFDALIAQLTDRVGTRAASGSLGRRLYRMGTHFWDAEPKLWQALVASSMSAEPQVRAAFAALIDRMLAVLSEEDGDGPEARLRAELAAGGLLGLWVTQLILEPGEQPSWAALESPVVGGLDRMFTGPAGD